ncbi:polysaccharide deacetylase family protein [Nostoc sp. FACHB-152]|uniref:polysaccharide deacetylase family protein n=1 Tax=unclassified Nostoc TaxID=2593658 RepID=UPI0016849B0F|nr:MULTISPECIES: polysaccharide deacetylase family protein [unclassified Nostoc]MBD2448002.1 polysaccharide deacetylase family protein [Nostoc sp. FACHB-152]MBD2466109.1 polysaccharide deacetylase family protein [Nostoc sp. FACHB-145]
MTDKNLKRGRIFGFVAIALFVTACSTIPQLTVHQSISTLLTAKVLDNWVQAQIDAQLPLSTQIEQSSVSIPARFQGKTLYKVEPNNKEKVIALTIDDGPWPKTTLQMLDIFKANNIKATFFWVGSAVQANPELAKRVVAEGHVIGNHTWHHWYKRMDEATAKSEIDRTSNLIYKTTGVKTTLFRPPGGFLNNGLAAYAKSQKYSVVMWSLTSADTDPHAKPQAFVNNVLKGAKPGAIVLMHDGGGDRHRTVQALPQIITGLKQQGYRFVTIPELLEKSGE